MTRAVVVGGGVGGMSSAIAIALAQRGVAVTLCESKSFLGGSRRRSRPRARSSTADRTSCSTPRASRMRSQRSASRSTISRCAAWTTSTRSRPMALHPFASSPTSARRWSASSATIGGQGVRYRKLVAAVTKVHRALAPLQVKARPSPLALIRAGAAWHAPFLLRSLAGVLAGAGLRGVVAEAVGTWTHVTGQPLDAAPSPLALVPAMIHGPGCFVPSRGVVGDRRAASRARLSRFPAVVPAPRGGAQRRDVHVRHARLPRT